MNLKCILPSQRSQTQKAVYCRIPFILYFEKAKLQGWKMDHWLPGVGRQSQEVTIKGRHGRNLGVDRSVLYRTVVVDTQLHAFVKIHRTVDHKNKFFTFKKIILLQVNFKKYPKCGGKDGMQIVTNDSKCIINISHDHTEGGGKKEADPSNFGKLDTEKLKSKRTERNTVPGR